MQMYGLTMSSLMNTTVPFFAILALPALLVSQIPFSRIFHFQLTDPRRLYLRQQICLQCGRLFFQMEHGAKPELSVDNHGRLVLPTIRTDHPSLGSIIRKAWLGHYSRTSEMLESLNCIDTNGVRHARVQLRSRSTESLRDRIRKWREYRENKFGMLSVICCHPLGT